MVSVEVAAYGRAVAHDGAPRGGEGWGSYGDILHLAEEVAGVGRLVVAAHLPHHSVAVLVVVPQRVVAPSSGGGGRVDADVVGCCAHDDLLAPVAKDVALEAGGGLGIVVGQGTATGIYGCPRTILGDGALGVLAIHAIECLLAQVAIPVDAEVGVYATAIESADGLIGYGADEALGG